jgi:hypothetical protein
MSVWKRWVRQPQNIWLRKALFQVHLWTGIGVGLYIFMISLTGSVLVYRNELFMAATPAPIDTYVPRVQGHERYSSAEPGSGGRHMAQARR